eukprot:TRINITY_DN11814_c0_g1_i1.p1 TRINITY_DN11814_c0_g1~~TRINITY_DN11814_c0_g1_i1.p1  ORF type:complete len:245 (-),score=31.15 TRINITY_DN11814_c0_g1_i1:22-756(-)
MKGQVLKRNILDVIPSPFVIGADKLNWNAFSKSHFRAFLQNKSLINTNSLVLSFGRALSFALKMSQLLNYSPVVVDTVPKVFRAEMIHKICEKYQIGAITRCRKAILPTLYSRISYVKKNWLLGKTKSTLDLYNNNSFINIKNSINLILILNTDKAAFIIKDSIKFGVPFIAIIGGDNNTNRITYPIPGNGRDYRSTVFFLEMLAEAKIQGVKDRIATEAKLLQLQKEQDDEKEDEEREREMKF